MPYIKQIQLTFYIYFYYLLNILLFIKNRPFLLLLNYFNDYLYFFTKLIFLYLILLMISIFIFYIIL